MEEQSLTQPDKAVKVTNNWPLLGGLRFLLALIVLSQHTAPAGGWGRSPFGWFAQGGAATAVIAFLMVSGFSIAHSINKEPKGFYMRRWNRIMPTFVVAYFLALIPLTLAAYYPDRATFPPIDSVWQFAANVLPVQVILVKALPTNGPTWSLGIECALYLLAPFFLLMPKKAIYAIIAFSAFVFAGASRYGMDGPAELHNPFVLLSLMWPWLLGWVIYHERDSELLQKAGIGLACVLYGLHITSPERFAFLTIAATTGVLLYQDQIKLSFKTARAFTIAGDISYPLYLVHMPLAMTIQFFSDSHLARAAAFLGPLLVAAAIHYGIEKPIARIPSKRKAQTLNASAVNPSPVK